MNDYDCETLVIHEMRGDCDETKHVLELQLTFIVRSLNLYNLVLHFDDGFISHYDILRIVVSKNIKLSLPVP